MYIPPHKQKGMLLHASLQVKDILLE